MTSRNPQERRPFSAPSILALRSTARTLACGMEHAKTWNNPGMFQEKRVDFPMDCFFWGKSEPETMVSSINIYIYIYVYIYIWVSCNFSHHPILWDYQKNCWDSMGISWEYHGDVRWCIQQHIIHIMWLFFLKIGELSSIHGAQNLGYPMFIGFEGALRRKNLGHII